MKGNYSTEDLYIDCYYNVRIFYYGKSILEVYFPSKQRGKNIVKEIKKVIGQDVIFDIVEGNSELLFKFKTKDFDKLVDYLKPKKSGANISPFSNKNLPVSDYEISEDKLEAYKKIIENKGKISTLGIAHTTKKFIESLATKHNPIEEINKDIKRHCMKPRQYIDYIGKWNEYLEFLDKNL